MTSSNATRVLEAKIVAHCSPVLAGLKPANMFSCSLKCAKCCGKTSCTSMSALDFVVAFESCRLRLLACGLRLEMLAQREKSVLLYLYRPELLEASLADSRVRAYLESSGYGAGLSATRLLGQLAQRIAAVDALAGAQKSCAFPHEVGLFLGYPFEDVMGFIKNAGQGYVASGCWKVYTHERDALDAFCRYEECKQQLTCRFESGARIEELAVSG